MRTFLFYILGMGMGTVIMSISYQEHIDTMEKLTYNMINDAYFVGCREAGDNPVNCHKKATEFTKPMEEQ